MNDGDTDKNIYKLVRRQWTVLPNRGDDVTIKDPKLKQGYLGDLKKKTVIELEEVLARNKQVLTNKFLVSKLKDKGKNLQARQRELAQALEEAREREKQIKEVPDQNDIHGFEWTGSLTNNTTSHNTRDVEDEDEELDPLKLMACHSECVEPKDNRSRVIDEDPSSVIARELEQLDISDSKFKEKVEKQEEALMFGAIRNKMFQEKYKLNGPAKVSFKPFRPVDNPRPIPGLHVRQKPVKNNPVISISSEESQKLEKEFLNKEKEREMKLTIEGLSRKSKVSNICQLPTNPVGNYRDSNIEKHILDSDEEDEEVDDDLDLYHHGILDDEDEEGIF